MRTCGSLKIRASPLPWRQAASRGACAPRDVIRLARLVDNQQVSAADQRLRGGAGKAALFWWRQTGARLCQLIVIACSLFWPSRQAASGSPRSCGIPARPPSPRAALADELADFAGASGAQICRPGAEGMRAFQQKNSTPHALESSGWPAGWLSPLTATTACFRGFKSVAFEAGQAVQTIARTSTDLGECLLGLT